jgi:hypothetical protein
MKPDVVITGDIAVLERRLKELEELFRRQLELLADLRQRRGVRSPDDPRR